MAAPIRVCFVCLGNICRSPTAEGVFLHLLRARGLEGRFVVDSAGTSAHHAGEAPDPRSAAAARARGVPLPSRSRPFTDADFARFDVILAMDHANLRALRRLRGAATFTGTLALLRDFDPASPPGAEVPDPYYGGPRGFDDVLDLCEAACAGLLQRLLPADPAAGPSAAG